MSTATKKNTQKNTQEVKNTKLIPVFALWARKDKNGNDYFTGKVEGEETKLVAFYNKKRTGMKDPDINVFYRYGEDILPYCKLLANASKAGKKYLTGKMDDTKVVGFFNEAHTVKQPYISIYTEQENKQIDGQEELPF